MVLACKATLKVEEVVDSVSEKKEKIEEALALQATNQDGVVYSESDQQRDITLLYVQTGWEFVKLYAPSVMCLGLGIGCIIWGHKILKGRNIALMAAYKGLKESYDALNDRLEEKYGKEEASLLRNGGEGYEEIVDTETGEVRKAMILPNGVKLSPYSVLWDEVTAYKTWNKSSANNLYFLRCQENAANHRLDSVGHLVLNDVYSLLGLDHTSDGAVVGWKKGNGDDYVRFGIYDTYGMYEPDEKGRRADGIMLDFNVDGIIYDLIGK